MKFWIEDPRLFELSLLELKATDRVAAILELRAMALEGALRGVMSEIHPDAIEVIEGDEIVVDVREANAERERVANEARATLIEARDRAEYERLQKIYEGKP